MSARIYEIAGALHKGTKQILTDLQEMNVEVRKISSLVSERDMLKVAEKYGRKEFVFPLISSEYIFELAKSWSQEEILRLLSDIKWSEGFLSEKDVKRLLAVKANVPDYIEEVLCAEAKYKNPKAVCSLYLVGNSRKAIMIPEEKREFHMFLIPKTKKDASPCCICFGDNKILYTSINVDSCMVLIWADGKYVYRPARFTKMQNTYFIEIDKMLKELEIEVPLYQGVNLNEKGIWATSMWLQPGKSGFAMQEKRKCSVKIDKNKLVICDGAIDEIAWITENESSTIKGSLGVRQAVDLFLENQGKLCHSNFQKEKQHLKETIKVEKIFAEDIPKDNDEGKMELVAEAYVRLKLLIQAGLLQEVSETFAKDRKLYMSQGNGGCKQLQDRLIEKHIRNFEIEHKAVAYYCTLTKEEKGMVINIFYVADRPKKWAKEREDIQKKRVTVYRENLSNRALSKEERVEFYLRNGGMVCS